MTSPAILVDFDGTACPIDVADALLTRFGRPGWEELDVAVERGEKTIRSAIDGQASMLVATRLEMLEYVLSTCAVAAGFAEFCDWAASRGHEVTVVSDGFGFYVAPLLQAAGLVRLPVITNQLVRRASGWYLRHPKSHPRCIGCGTCKMLAVTERQRTGDWVAFVGNGPSDRFASFYADVVFARERLAEICLKEGVKFHPWDTFHDVRRMLECLPEPLAAKEIPTLCPGWTTQ
jgi:2-hydroxy-3-keto-5-methylthiopentenyl-1-phosphate phosphatase